MTAVLIVYGIRVITSSVLWVRYAVSKSTLTGGGNTRNVRLQADADTSKKNAHTTTDTATELTDVAREDAMADGQAGDIVK